MLTTGKERIVIIGGGFAGLNLIKSLDRNRCDVILVDRHNYHSFPPLFYQIASSGLDPGSINFPLRRELYRKLKKGNTGFSMRTALSVDPENKTVTTDRETISYDKLIIAIGTTNNFFNMPQLKEKVFTLKSTPQALRCRNEILDRLERASITESDEERRQLLSFVVVGGGPTGVEIAGAIGEMKRYVVKREYPSLKPSELSVTIIEGSQKILRAMSEISSHRAEKYLSDLMVTVKTGVVMTDYDGNTVTLDSGDKLQAGMVIWTAGVTGCPLEFIGHELKRGKGNRLIVDGVNKVKGLQDIYAVGDIAIMPGVDPKFPDGHPQLAQTAIQQAKLLARNLNNGKQEEFRYKDKGTMATVGRNRAVADIGGLHAGGFVAWILWMMVHLISILGMRNKITVLINWIWAYFSYQTSLRLLIFPEKFPSSAHMTDSCDTDPG